MNTFLVLLSIYLILSYTLFWRFVCWWDGLKQPTDDDEVYLLTVLWLLSPVFPLSFIMQFVVSVFSNVAIWIGFGGRK